MTRSEKIELLKGIKAGARRIHDLNSHDEIYFQEGDKITEQGTGIVYSAVDFHRLKDGTDYSLVIFEDHFAK